MVAGKFRTNERMVCIETDHTWIPRTAWVVCSGGEGGLIESVCSSTSLEEPLTVDRELDMVARSQDAAQYNELVTVTSVISITVTSWHTGAR